MGEVPFGSWMRENYDFIVPVNILTPFTHALSSYATRHTTVCLVVCEISNDRDMYEVELNFSRTEPSIFLQ